MARFYDGLRLRRGNQNGRLINGRIRWGKIVISEDKEDDLGVD